jgi:hypothetical protein
MATRSDDKKPAKGKGEKNEKAERVPPWKRTSKMLDDVRTLLGVSYLDSQLLDTKTNTFVAKTDGELESDVEAWAALGPDEQLRALGAVMLANAILLDDLRRIGLRHTSLLQGTQRARIVREEQGRKRPARRDRDEPGDEFDGDGDDGADDDKDDPEVARQADAFLARGKRGQPAPVPGELDDGIDYEDDGESPAGLPDPTGIAARAIAEAEARVRGAPPPSPAPTSAPAPESPGAPTASD